MYLKNIFPNRPTQIIATVASFAFGAYNLYILGRTDEVKEICEITKHSGEEGFEAGFTFKPWGKIYNIDTRIQS